MLKRVARRLLPDRWWTALRLARLRWTLTSYRPRDVTHRYGPLTLTIHLADPMAEGWYDHDWDEPAELAVLRTGRLAPGARVFDIGAHQGVVALLLANVVGPSGKVIAIEANGHNARVARTNRDRNGATNVDVMHAAAAQRDGTIWINHGLNAAVDHGSGAWGRTEVPAVSVDTLARRYGTPDVLYIDVEGYECAVLRGAVETLRHDPDVFVEVHADLQPQGDSVAEILRTLDESRYQRFAATEEHVVFQPLTAGDPVLQERRFFLVAIARSRTVT